MTCPLSVPFQITAEIHQIESGGYWAEVLRFPGCIAQAETIEALGAQQGAIARMFVSHALLLAGIGAAIGLAGAIELMQLMKSLLFGISPRDPLTYILVPAALITISALASYFPARRAAAVDPANTLRAD